MDYSIEQEFKKVYKQLKCKANCLGILPSGVCNEDLFLNQCGNWVEVGGGGTPSAPVNSIQYNNAGSFYGDSLHTIDPITKNLSFIKPQGSDIEEQFIQSDDLLGVGLNGTLIGHTNSVTGETIRLALIDGTPFGHPYAATFGYSSGAGEAYMYEVDNTRIFFGATDSVSQTRSQYYSDLTGNVMLWDLDVNDNIKSTFEQNSNLLGLGVTGNIMLHQNTNTGDKAAWFTANTGSYAVGGLVINGIAKSVANFNSTQAQIGFIPNTGGAEQSQFVAKQGQAYLSYTLDGTTEYRTILNDGVFKIRDETNTTDYFTVDIINSTLTINTALVPDYADDTAAGVGGLTSGQLYKTTTLGSTFIKIVP